MGAGHGWRASDDRPRVTRTLRLGRTPGLNKEKEADQAAQPARHRANQLFRFGPGSKTGNPTIE